MRSARNDVEDTCLTIIIASDNAYGYSTTFENQDRSKKSFDFMKKGSAPSISAPFDTIDAKESTNNRISNSSDNDEDFSEGDLRA